MPAMSPVRTAVAVATGLLAVAIVAVLLLSGDGGPIGRPPAASSAPSSSAEPDATTGPGTDASPSATASPIAGEDEIQAMLTEIEEQVLEIRGLPAPDIGPAELISREELTVELEELFAEQYPPDARERDNRVLRAFGLLGPDEDVGELQLDLLSAQVVGFYDQTEERMVVVSDTGLDANAKITYAHEYTHALQDAAFGLDTLETDAVGEDDRGLARVALIEGDATVTMLAWALRHLSQAELGEIGSTPIPDTADVPGWMMSQLIFPYVAGQEWILAMMSDAGASPLDPDFAPVDAAFGEPPESTAQVLDYQKWVERIQPVEVELPELARSLGSGWEEVTASSVGQATTGIVLEHFGVEAPEVGAATDGWAGDRAVVAFGPDDEFALAWRSTWETEDDAIEFESAYDAALEQLGFPALVSREGDTVLVAHAASEDVLRRTVEAAR